MTEEERIRRDRDDKAFLANPSFWAYWPYQTLKRYKNGGTETAILFEGSSGGPSAYKIARNANLFGMIQGTQKPTFDSVTLEQVLVEGWLVD